MTSEETSSDAQREQMQEGLDAVAQEMQERARPQVVSDAAPSKRRRRPRSPRAATVEREPDVSPEVTASVNAAFGLVAALPYDLLARRNIVWTLTEQERANLGQAARVLADRYIMDWLRDYPELAAYALVNVVILLPRVMTIWSAQHATSSARPSGVGQDDLGKDTARTIA